MALPLKKNRPEGPAKVVRAGELDYAHARAPGIRTYRLLVVTAGVISLIDVLGYSPEIDRKSVV